MLNSLTFFLMGVLAISEKDITQDYIFKHMGHWMHPSQQYVVQLHGCEDGMCGTVVWVSETAVKRDVNNKDETLKGRSLCGLRVVSGLATDGHVNIYKKGKMYRTDNGQTTSVKASYLSSEEVQMHSYQGVSMIGDTQVWLRVNEKDYPPCIPLAPLSVAIESQAEPTTPRARDFMPDADFNPVVSSEPISLTPSVATMEVKAETTKAVVQDPVVPEVMTTNSNLKTKAIEVSPSVSSPFKKIERQAPRVLQLEVIE